MTQTEPTPERAPEPTPTGPGGGTYDVVLLVEQRLSAGDAGRVRSLHEGVEEPVSYHVVMPVDDAAAQVEAAMGSLSSADTLAPPASAYDPALVDAAADGAAAHALAELEATVAALEGVGGTVGSHRAVGDEPVQALVDAVADHAAREVIVLTRPHVVAEFFHVDWTSRAQRKLDVPVLHLIEQESFDEQAGGGEGVSGL